MELRQPEPFSSFDEHHRRVGYVYSDLDHRRRYQNVEFARRERAHGLVLLGRSHTSTQQSEAQARQLTFTQARVLRGAARASTAADSSTSGQITKA